MSLGQSKKHSESDSSAVGIASRRARRRVGIPVLQALRHVPFIRYILTDVWCEAVPARCAVSLIYESKLYVRLTERLISFCKISLPLNKRYLL